MTYAEAFPNAQKTTVEGGKIPYLSLHELIRSKQTYRDQDRVDLENLLRLTK